VTSIRFYQLVKSGIFAQIRTVPRTKLGHYPKRGSGSVTNSFSKKLENHAYSVALFVMFYNFCRIHKTLRVTPAMAAGVSDRLWEVSDIVALLEATEAKPDKRGSYKKRMAA
jgi:hypothetical protein